MGVHRNHRAGDHQHQHHVGLGLPIGGQQVDHEQRGLRQHGGDRQVARAVAHAVAKIDPDHDGIDGQRRLAADHQPETGAGVIVEHAENPSRRIMPRPTHDGLTQHDGGQQKQGNVSDHRQIGIEALARQKTEHAHVNQRDTGDDDAQIGLVELGVLFELHGGTSLCGSRHKQHESTGNAFARC